MKCMFVFAPKFICWNPNPQCHGIWRRWLWVVIRSWGQICQDGISDLIRIEKWTCFSLLSTIWRGRQMLSANQEECSRQEQNSRAPWFWTSQQPELWEINFRCLSHQLCGDLQNNVNVTENQQFKDYSGRFQHSSLNNW